ncbi:hypothetical protein Hanom_Chr11g01013961 [Helianthus anomalus]
MSPEIGESSKSESSYDVLYYIWGTPSFNNLLQEYDIKPERHPVLPLEKDTAFPLKEGKITMFSDFFKFYNFRLPINKFCKAVLDEYQIHIS